MSESPSRLLTRQEEKQELGHLNNRLTVYIARVKELQDANNQLNIEIQILRSTHAESITVLKREYETELALVRKTLDEESNEKAKYQVDLGAKDADLARLRKLLDQEILARKALQDQVNDLNEKYERTQADLRAAQAFARSEGARAAKAEKLLADFEKDLLAERKRTEEETLRRVAIENQIQTLQEDLDFHRGVAERREEELQREVTLALTKAKMIEEEAKAKYNNDLALALAQARERYEEEAAIFRDEIKEFYERQAALVVPNDADKLTISALRGELADARLKYEAIRAEQAGVTARIAELEAEIKSLKDTIAYLRVQHSRDLAAKDDIIARLQATIAEKDRLYKDLLDDRIALDAEIASYNKLLEGEEGRLNLNSPPNGSVKRKRSIKQ